MSITEITVAELADQLQAGARLIDVREDDEFAEAHVPGAIHIRLGSVPANVAGFKSEGTTFVICKAGGRSLQACEFVASQDDSISVANVAGGTMAWIESGRAVEKGLVS